MSKKGRFSKINVGSLLVVFGLFILTFILRLPTFWKPFDMAYEAQVAFLGREAFVGDGFYATPWSLKPPGDVFTYGLGYLLFGFEKWPVSVRVFSAVLAGLASVFIYKLGKNLFGSLSGFTAALCFTFFFSRGDIFLGTASYAEMLMPFFTIFGFYLFFLSEKKKSKLILFFAGSSLGTSLLYKQSAVYDFAPLFLYSIGKTFFRLRKEERTFKSILLANLPLVLGFALPMAIFTFYILFIGKFRLFLDWVVLKPMLYAKLREKHPWGYIRGMFKKIYPVAILAFLGIGVTLFRREGKRFLFILWFFFTILTFISSGKFWNYYFLQPFVPICFLAGIFIGDVVSPERKFVSAAFFTFLLLILINLNKDHYRRLFNRYLSFLGGEMNRADYVLSLSERDLWKMRLDAAEFLRENSRPEETLFAMEGTTGFYVLADKLPIYKNFIFKQQFFENKAIGFAFMQSFETVEENRRKLMENLRKTPPTFVTLVEDDPSGVFAEIKEFPQFFSFVFENYSLIANFDDIWLYQLNREETIVPKSLVVDFDFVKNYLLVTPSLGGKVILEPFAGVPTTFEASLAEEDVVDLAVSSLEAVFFGFDGNDLVGHALDYPSGTEDLHLRTKGASKSIKMVRIRSGEAMWSYPANGINSIIRLVEDQGALDLYFERPRLWEGEIFNVHVIYEDDSSAATEVIG